MKWGPTANFVGGQLVACYYNTCERYDNATGEWTKIADTSSTRFKHSSAQIENQILLIGGTPPNFTEWIPANGGPSVKHSSIKELLPPGRGSAGVAQQCPVGK